MAIEIYDKAKVIKKDGRYYYLLKYGSKNSFTYGGQYILGDDFRRKYLQRESRDSHWSIIADGEQAEYDTDQISDTYYNSSTGSMYGKIRFGNGKNIALYYVKNKEKLIDYDTLDSQQQSAVDGLIRHYESDEAKQYRCNLADIPEGKKFKAIDTYCRKQTFLDGNSKHYNGRIYWDLDNL